MLAGKGFRTHPYGARGRDSECWCRAVCTLSPHLASCAGYLLAAKSLHPGQPTKGRSARPSWGRSHEQASPWGMLCSLLIAQHASLPPQQNMGGFFFLFMRRENRPPFGQGSFAFINRAVMHGHALSQRSQTNACSFFFCHNPGVVTSQHCIRSGCCITRALGLLHAPQTWACMHFPSPEPCTLPYCLLWSKHCSSLIIS